MRFSVAAAAVLSAAVSAQAQTTWNVIVGQNETLTYTPSSLNGVANGDIVSFQFVSKNHSVTQSSFAAPCTASGVSSGFQDVPDVNASTFPTWSITIENNTSPLWFFCAQTTNTTTHCQDGMVFAINPTATKNFTTFQAAAMATANNATTPGQNPPGTVVTSAGVDGPLSAGTISSQTAEAASPSGTPSTTGGNSTSNGTSSTTGTSSGSSPTTTNAAIKMSGSSISLLAVAGLVAGLAL